MKDKAKTIIARSTTCVRLHHKTAVVRAHTTINMLLTECSARNQSHELVS